MTVSVLKNMVVKWVDFHKHMLVRDDNGVLLFSTESGFKNPRLTADELDFLETYYYKNKKSYDFN